MKIDESTGLPELPEGYFWRVVRSSERYLRVQLRQKRWIGSEVVSWSALKKKNANPEEIRNTARYALSKWPQEEGGQGSEWEKYLGNYPPKKLESM